MIFCIFMVASHGLGHGLGGLDIGTNGFDVCINEYIIRYNNTATTAILSTVRIKYCLNTSLLCDSDMAPLMIVYCAKLQFVA